MFKYQIHLHKILIDKYTLTPRNPRTTVFQ